jgi:hypothetical protein
MTLEDNITDIVNSIDELASKFQLKNNFGYTIGDELNEIKYFLKSISESLEKIANK